MSTKVFLCVCITIGQNYSLCTISVISKDQFSLSLHKKKKIHKRKRILYLCVLLLFFLLSVCVRFFGVWLCVYLSRQISPYEWIHQTKRKSFCALLCVFVGVCVCVSAIICMIKTYISTVGFYSFIHYNSSCRFFVVVCLFEIIWIIIM